MVEVRTGWERERRTHFDEIVVNYDKARWEYPPEVFADIFDYARIGAKGTALEIGAGTGKATRPFLAAGCKVTAVELGENMAAFLQDKYQNDSKLSIIFSAFEDIELNASSYDIVYSASAFHWVDAGIGCPKVFNILKSKGVFALFRNNFITSYELYEDLHDLYKLHYLSIYPRNTKKEPYTSVSLSQLSEIKRGFGFSGMEQFGFYDVNMRFYEARQSYSATEYIALLETMADHRSLPESNKKALYTGIGESINKRGGFCELDFLFQLYIGRKP